MCKTVKRVILVAICFVVGFMFGGMHRQTKTRTIMYKTDTIECVRLDTCRIIVPEYKYIRTVDTILINSDDGHSVSLPITQKHYAKDSVYDAWVSGYNPQLDSISIYERIENKTITKTIVKFVENKKWDVYYYAGLSKNHDENYATLGVTINSPRKWSLGLNAGIGDNGNICYGFKIGFKIK